MLHEGKGLGFGLETGDDLGGIHAELNELESDTATERTSLLGEINDPHATAAEFLEQGVAFDRSLMLQRNMFPGRRGNRSV